MKMKCYGSRPALENINTYFLKNTLINMLQMRQKNKYIRIDSSDRDHVSI